MVIATGKCRGGRTDTHSRRGASMPAGNKRGGRGQREIFAARARKRTRYIRTHKRGENRAICIHQFVMCFQFSVWRIVRMHLSHTVLPSTWLRAQCNRQYTCQSHARCQDREKIPKEPHALGKKGKPRDVYCSYDVYPCCGLFLELLLCAFPVVWRGRGCLHIYLCDPQACLSFSNSCLFGHVPS